MSISEPEEPGRKLDAQRERKDQVETQSRKDGRCAAPDPSFGCSKLSPMETFGNKNGGDDRKLLLNVVIKSKLVRVGSEPNSFSFGFLLIGNESFN